MDKRTKHKDALDRISSLPDPILSHILSFLPGKDSVRSSVLSSRWRYLFTVMSTLDFGNYLSDESGKNINIDSFKNFVDSVFSHPNQVNLERFKVHDFWVNDLLLLDDDYSRLHNWICAALRRGVKELDIDLELDSGLELPISLLFTCQSLVTLKLGFYSYPIHVPVNVGLPNLKTLLLTSVEFEGGCSIHRLISSLHVLEDLVIRECYFVDTSELNIHNLSLKRLVIDFQSTDPDSKIYDYVIVINAPSLVYFEYLDIVGEGYTLSNMSSLGEAYIRLYPLEDVDREQSASQLFQGIRNVQYLDLYVEGLDTLPRRLLYEHIILDNLVELRFEHYHDYGIWRGRWLLEFLHCVPNLKTLEMHLAGTNGGFRGLLEEVPSCLSSHLKKITIVRYKETEHMLELISYFLNNAIVLEKLVLGIEAFSEKNELRILKRLLRLPKKSKKCEVVIF